MMCGYLLVNVGREMVSAKNLSKSREEDLNSLYLRCWSLNHRFHRVLTIFPGEIQTQPQTSLAFLK